MDPSQDSPGQRRGHLTLLTGAAKRRSREVAGTLARADEPAVAARLAVVVDRCWQCRTKVRGVVGVLVDPARTADGTGFLPFDDVAAELARRVDPRALRKRGIGELRHRDSPGVAGGYVSNGCMDCDALIGRFQLEDLLHEHLQAGGTYAQLDIGIRIELPEIAVARLQSARG
jgi:hypothetical protein